MFSKKACNLVFIGKYVDKHSFSSVTSMNDWPKLALQMFFIYYLHLETKIKSRKFATTRNILLSYMLLISIIMK